MSKRIFRVAKNRNFSILSNDPFNDPELSWKAKGLLGYLLTRPDNWNINVEQLRKASAGGRDTIYSTLRELIDARYISRSLLRDEKGRSNGYLYIISETKIPIGEIPFTEKPEKENPDLNKDLSVVSTDCNKDGETAKPPPNPLKERKINFCKQLLEWQKRQPGKYPKQMLKDFAEYWLEPSKVSKKIRFDGEKYFDFSKRVHTWFKKTKDEELSKMWELEKESPDLRAQLLTLVKN